MKKKHIQYLNKYFLIISAFLYVTQTIGQTFTDNIYCLIDSLNLEILPKTEKKLKNTLSKTHYNSIQCKLKITAINKIIAASFEDNVWSKYNKLMNGFIKEKLKAATIDCCVQVLEEKLIKPLFESLNNIVQVN